VAVLGAFVLAGCGSTEQGEPYVVATAQSAAQSAKAAALPPRPTELSLQGVDPCSLLTGTQLDRRKVDSKPRQAASNGGPSCSFDIDQTKPYYSYGITAVTSADLDALLTGARRKNSDHRARADRRFPALKNFRAGGAPGDCEMRVGVAKGQTLVVRAFPVTAGAFSRP
jgi:hypothetical protein